MDRTGHPSRIAGGVTTTAYCRSIVLGAMAATLLVAPPTSADPAAPAVPDEVRAVLAPNDLVLAYEKADATGYGATNLVIAVYRGARFTEQPDTSTGNACELLVFTGTDPGVVPGAHGAWKETERSREAIDCVDNPVMDRPREMAYRDNLKVEPGSITWSNQGIRRHTTFTFIHHRADGRWYVGSMSQGYVVTAARPNGDVVTAYGEIASPRDFPLTPMSELKVAPLQRLLDTRTSTEG